LNKLDLLPLDERETRAAQFVKALRWKGPMFAISAINGDGCRALTFAVQAWLDEHPKAIEAPPVAEEAPIVVTPAPVTTSRRRRAARK
jgi:GTP-binding protein